MNGAPTTIAVTAATNRLAYSSYDANGNMLTGVGATLTYDERNRLATATPMSGGTAYYGYAPDNKRIYQKTAAGTEEWYLYDPRGERVGTFTVGTSGSYPYLTPYLVVAQTNVWFAVPVAGLRPQTGIKPALDRAIRGAGTGMRTRAAMR